MAPQELSVVLGAARRIVEVLGRAGYEDLKVMTFERSVDVLSASGKERLGTAIWVDGQLRVWLAIPSVG